MRRSTDKKYRRIRRQGKAALDRLRLQSGTKPSNPKEAFGDAKMPVGLSPGHGHH
jgi:hypothetical protein